LRHRILLGLAILLLAAGISVALIDQVILPSRASNRLGAPWTGTYVTRLNPPTSSPRPSYVSIDVVIYSNFVRYGLFLPGTGDYELSFAESPWAPAKVVSDCPNNGIDVIANWQGHPAAWRLAARYTSPATDTSIKDNWDFYWDVPLHAVQVGIGVRKIPIYPASDTHYAYYPRKADHPSVLTSAQIQVFLRAPQSSFANNAGSTSDTSTFTSLSVDLSRTQRQWMTVRQDWLAFLADNALSVAFLGAGMLLGTVDWGAAIRRRHEPD
jgi:hypothetical protein